MDTKIVVLISLMCAASGPAAASLVAPLPIARADPLPQYSYGYDVQDALTGDYKGHQEHRNGDVVTGSYTVVDPDGTRRIVDYTADPLNGFNAVVRRQPLVINAPVAAPARLLAPAPVIAPIASFLPRAPVLGPGPAPLLAPRPPSPYSFY